MPNKAKCSTLLCGLFMWWQQQGVHSSLRTTQIFRIRYISEHLLYTKRIYHSSATRVLREYVCIYRHSFYHHIAWYNCVVLWLPKYQSFEREREISRERHVLENSERRAKADLTHSQGADTTCAPAERVSKRLYGKNTYKNVATG